MAPITWWTLWQGALQTIFIMMPWKTLLTLRLHQVSLPFTLHGLTWQQQPASCNASQIALEATQAASRSYGQEHAACNPSLGWVPFPWTRLCAGAAAVPQESPDEDHMAWDGARPRGPAQRRSEAPQRSWHAGSKADCAPGRSAEEAWETGAPIAQHSHLSHRAGSTLTAICQPIHALQFPLSILHPRSLAAASSSCSYCSNAPPS